MAQSILIRMWEAVIPPSPGKGARKSMTPQRQKQLRMVAITVGVILAAGIGWAIYGYMSTAPQRAQEQFTETEKFLAAGQYTQAVTGFTRTLAIWPQMPNAYVERALAHHALAENQQAMEDLDRALQLDPNLAAAYAARGSISRDLGDVSQAMQEFTKSIQSHPNANAYFERGQLYEKLGQHQNAIADYDEAIAYFRDAPHIYRARAFAKANMGDLEGAKADRTMAQSLEAR